MRQGFAKTKDRQQCARKIHFSALLAMQRGVALITVLMVFAIGTVLVSKIVLQRSVDAQRISAMVARAQAHYYARAGEDLAILGLRAADELDDESNNFLRSDNLQEIWAAAPISYDVDGFGQVAVQIIDLNRYYNINNMLEPDGTINGQERERFRSLLVELDLPEDLADNLADWLDKDDSETGYASESASYMSGDLSYRAANQAMHDIYELYQIEGFDVDVLEVLAPHITALPMRDILPLNVNTATRYALTTLHEVAGSGTSSRSIGMSGANSIIDERPYESSLDFDRSGLTEIKNRSEYGQSPTASGSVTGTLNSQRERRARYGFSSTYFQLNTRANYGGQVAYLTTTVQQNGEGESATFVILSREESDNSARFVQQF